MAETSSDHAYQVDQEERPVLRPVEPRWITYQGEQRLWLRDPLALSERMVLVPAVVAPLVALLDGERTPSGIKAAFEVRYGTRLPSGFVEQFLAALQEAALLFGPAYAAARERVLADYRAAPFRPPALAGNGYPADPEALHQLLARYAAEARVNGAARANGRLRGLITPHIDYARGGAEYARAWLPARAAVAAAELVVIFGTDHAGSAGALTLTRQRYATPWGPFPQDQAVVERLVAALGEEAAFAEELHHRSEHSIELATVWLHWLLREAGRADDLPPLVPILCGSFAPYTHGAADPLADRARAQALAALRAATAGRRVLVVASADLAHVGPAFGDERGWDVFARASLKASDERLLAVAATGDPADFLATLRTDQDAHRICGLPPIYWALHALDGAVGETLGYDQCPADEAGASWVTIAGMAYT